MEFVVKAKGKESNQWVLAVDGERLLIANDHKLEWVDMVDCEFVGFVDPSTPKPVFPVQVPEQGPGLAVVRSHLRPNGS